MFQVNSFVTPIIGLCFVWIKSYNVICSLLSSVDSFRIWFGNFGRLEDVYDNVAEIESRFTELNKLFEEKYHCKPDFYVRAPGRVNLIGKSMNSYWIWLLEILEVKNGKYFVHFSGWPKRYDKWVEDEYVNKQNEMNRALMKMNNKSNKDKESKPYFKTSLLSELVLDFVDFDDRTWRVR